MLISNKTVLTTEVAFLLGILSKSRTSVLLKPLAFIFPYLASYFCRNESTENLSLQVSDKEICRCDNR